MYGHRCYQHNTAKRLYLTVMSLKLQSYHCYYCYKIITFILNVVMPSLSGCIVHWALNYHYLNLYS